MKLHVIDSSAEGIKSFSVNYKHSYVTVELSRDCSRLITTVNGQDDLVEWKLNAFEPLVQDSLKKLAKKESWGFAPFRNMPWQGIGFWKENKFALATTKRIRQAWTWLLSHVDSQTLKLDKTLYQATHNPRPSRFFEHCGILKSCDYLMQDVINFRAAAIVVDRPELFFNLTHYGQKIGNERIVDHYPNWGFKQAHGYTDDRLTLEEAIGALASDWKRCYSYNLRPYTSLNKTLSNLPRVGPETASRLNLVRLERPLLTKAELWLMAWGFKIKGGKLDSNGEEIHHHNEVFKKSGPQEIQRALKILAGHQQRPLNHHCAAHVIDLVHYALDYPGEHQGALPGLINKSIRHHRDVYARRIREDTAFPPEKETALPVIMPPKTPKVTFLKSVADVIREGDLMAHCIGGYANGAVRGLFHLFHVEHNYFSASVQVDANTGRVIQAYGPNNTKNAASEWGTKYLSKWGKGIPEAKAIENRIGSKHRKLLEQVA